MGQFEAFLLDRRIASGRPNRQEDYFGGRYDITPYEEMKIYRAVDIDDYCWLKYDVLDDGVKWEEVFGWMV